MNSKNIDYHLSNTQFNKRFKSFKLDLLDKNYDSDTQTIMNFDDEYNEIPNLYNKKRNLKKNKKEKNSVKKKSKFRNNSYNDNDINKSLKYLMELKTDDKKDISDLIMKNLLILKKDQDENEIIREKNRNKFRYIKSKIKDSLLSTPQNTYGRKGFQIETEKGNPEFIKDMNYAQFKLKKQLKKENKLIADILFNGNNSTSKKFKPLTRREIDKKIKTTLERKRKKLQKIEYQIFEEQKLELTFSPSINHKKNDKGKRSFNSFITDQNNFQKKIKINRRNLLIKSRSEENLMNIGHPLIDRKSEIIARKLNVDKNVYNRLSKRDTYDHYKIKKFENSLLATNNKNNTNNSNSPDFKNSKSKNKYSHIKSKINIWENTKTEQNINDNKNDKNNNIRNTSNIKTLARRAKSSNDLFFDKKNFISTNKLLWNKFNKNFAKCVEFILLNKNKKNSGKENKISIISDELDENQYYELLYNLGMVNYIKEKEEDDDKKETELNTKMKRNKIKKYLISHITSINSKEKNLLKNSFNALKLGKDKIKISNLKIFLYFILNLHNYYFYHEYKLNHSSEEIQKLYPSEKYDKDEIALEMINKYNKELLSEIDKSNINNTKYFYISKNNKNKIIITLDNYDKIKKDFFLFNMNYRNHKIENLHKNILESKNSNSPYKLKDQLNSTTNRLNKINKSQNKVKSKEYIDRLLFQKKKQKEKQDKIKEELESKKIQECTFKPKINLIFPSYIKDKKSSKDKNMNNKNINRLEEMYEHGRKAVKARKNKSKIEIEIEEQINECTFQPHLYTATKPKKQNYNVFKDIYKDEQNRSFFDRLKQGRYNKMVKEKSKERYDLSDELKKYLKDYKENNVLKSQEYYNKTDSSCYYNNKSMYINENYNTDENNKGNCNKNINDKSDKKFIFKKKCVENKIESINIIEKGNKKSKKCENKVKKKIPLFIFDIKIKEGVNKNVYVYEGDTAESIAKKLAEENNMDIDTQRKIENIINEKLVEHVTKRKE